MSLSQGRFAGRVALVTGASRGIGYAIAERLVAEGARVCITARKPDPLAAAAETLGGSDHVIAVAGKADDAEHQAAAVAATLDAYGRLDVLVNNTGINPTFGPMLEQDVGAARKIFDVNVLGAIGWVREAHQAWLAGHGGAIVNVASIAGTSVAPGLGYYAASKAALIQVTSQLAFELSPKVRVNAVAPAVVKTAFAASLYEGREAEAAAGYALGRLGEPADVAGPVAFFASDDAAWVTGQTLIIDGGVSLMRGLG
jgi:NAD(P)-dependent dehydrogenase (short-subunit alcohol dehydrogenase family)